MAGREGLSAARPFPGLRPFNDEDRDFFFGREEQIYALYNLLELSQFVAVVGGSGSGKSSLVRAGLLPLLERESEEVVERGDAAASHAWRWIELRPGDGPVSRLADELAKLAVPEERGAIARAARRERIDYALRRASFGIGEALAEIDGLTGISLLIVVDQFEELFRYGGISAARARLEEERDQFVELLLEATSMRDLDVHVLITIRSDFIGDCAQFSGLPEAVSTCQFLVPSLTRDQREQIIRRPLDEDHANSTIEPALVERLLNDAGSDLDQLPVLQHCLSRLWEVAGLSRPTPPHRQLRLEHYTAVGGVSDALSRHADEILAGLDGHEIAVEQVFRALSEVDREGRATRRALSYADLRAETGVGDDELRLVVDRFRADDCSFLVPPISAEPLLNDNLTIDIGHEALLRRWKKIGAEVPETFDTENAAGWLEAEANDAHVYRAMVTLAGPNPAAMLPLDQVDDRWAWWCQRPRTAAWANRYGGRIERVQRLFDNSLSAQKRLIEAELAAKRRKRIRIGAYAGLAAVALLGIGAFFYLDNRHKAEIAEISKQQAKIARQERGELLNEMTDVMQQLSTQLRFIPGTNATILQMLNQIQDFSNKYSKWLSDHNPGGVSPVDQQVEARLNFTAKILQADYSINFGKVGDAIKILSDAETALEAVPTDANEAPLKLLRADIKIHRANGEAFYEALEDARRDYRDAQAILSQLAIDRRSSQPLSDSEEILPSLDYREAAKQRLADLYERRLFMELQFLHDADAALEDFVALGKLISDETNTHPPGDSQDELAANSSSAPDQLAKYWADHSKRLGRLRADLLVAQGHLNEAIPQYQALIAQGQHSTSVMAEVGDAFLKYKLALALTQRAQDGDLAEAVSHLKRADKVFSRLAETDSKNSWWPLVCGWIERALGEAYTIQQDDAGAADAYNAAIERDRALLSMDPGNPATRVALAHDKAAALGRGK